jgi:predicted acylesterase/phospholipase RssA
LDELVKNNHINLLKDIDRIGGTSAGSIIALLLSIGLKPDNLIECIKSIKFDTFLDFNSKSLNLTDLKNKANELKQGLTLRNIINCYSNYNYIKFIFNELSENFGLCKGIKIKKNF